jgi:hypothetical protein
MESKAMLLQKFMAIDAFDTEKDKEIKNPCSAYGQSPTCVNKVLTLFKY